MRGSESPGIAADTVRRLASEDCSAGDKANNSPRTTSVSIKKRAHKPKMMIMGARLSLSL